jgi:hypothetical protein
MLTTQRPSMIATKMICLACGESMPLKLIEPAYDGKRVDIHTFTCSKCLLSEAYAFPRDWGGRAPEGKPQQKCGSKYLWPIIRFSQPMCI